LLPDGKLEVTWHNDIPGYGDSHVSTYSKEFLDGFSGHFDGGRDQGLLRIRSQKIWTQSLISNKVKFIDFDKYMSSDSVLYDALVQLRVYGLLFIRGVPDSTTAVEDIGERIGDLKHTFYGRTWDVKSVPEAENIAYTNRFLGLHMDMLYTSAPPSLQLLHCLKNSCEGGSSLFSDSTNAAVQLLLEDTKKFKALAETRMIFHYKNGGRNYVQARKAIEVWEAGSTTISRVNWSPPFQAPFQLHKGILDNANLDKFETQVKAMKSFVKYIEDPKNVYEHRLQEGECVIFDNRRVLHGRRAFDTSSGERWLKGAYLDAQVWEQRYLNLHNNMKWLGIC
jgi:alpha-ketoglutarate-dependent taurine dioxygenase